MLLSVNGSSVPHLLPRYAGKEVIIGIDSSKTNTAMTVGDMSGKIKDYIELNGKEDKDVLQLCFEERTELRQLFHGAHIVFCGIEDIITTKSQGLSEHMSRFKITAVFMSIIMFFQDTHGITPELVNNMTWKDVILPKEFNTREYKKGSLAYFKSINSNYGYCSDDVTDSICIFMYICKIHGIEDIMAIDKKEHSTKEFTFMLLPTNFVPKHLVKRFSYNSELTIEDNATVMSNYINQETLGMCIVETSMVDVADIYKLCKGNFKQKETQLKLCVKLKE